LISLSSTSTIRSNTCGGGPSIDSKGDGGAAAGHRKSAAGGATAGAAAESAACRQQQRRAARSGWPVRPGKKAADVSLITPSDIVKMR